MNKIFCLVKSSRDYTGHPYCGPTSRKLGIEPTSFTIEEIRYIRKLYIMANPVGWDIYNMISGEKVD